MRIAMLACVGALSGALQAAIAAAPDPRPSAFVAEMQSGFGAGHVRVELKGGALFYQSERARTARIVPSEREWREFRRALDDIGVWSWRPRYERNVTDAASWSLEIAYADRSVKTGGYAAGPGKAYKRYEYALQRLLGDRMLGGRLVGKLEVFELEELRLVAAHPSPRAAQSWVEIRDPSGRTYRARVGDFIGPDYGKLEEVTARSIRLKELVIDRDGDWVERTTTMEIR